MDAKIEISFPVLNFVAVDKPELITVVVRMDSTEGLHVEVDQKVFSADDFNEMHKQSMSDAYAGKLYSVGYTLVNAGTMDKIKDTLSFVKVQSEVIAWYVITR